MRFAIATTDRYLDIFIALVARAWQPVKVFTCAMDNRQHSNSGVIDLARRLKVDVQISRLTDTNLRELAAMGCEALVVASYDWRIGDWRPHLKYAVNFHPSAHLGPWNVSLQSTTRYCSCGGPWAGRSLTS